MKYYVSKYFDVREYVTPDLYEENGEKSILAIDYRILKTDDSLREYFGVPIIINTWFNQNMINLYGLRLYSGYRPEDVCVKYKHKWSQHRFGRASDKILVGLNINDVRKEILKNYMHFPYIAVIEKKVSWLHTDCRCITNNNIVLI